MIELYISSTVTTNSLIITQKLSTGNIEFQVYENYSSICTKTQSSIEKGYYIKFFDLEPADFKNKVWEKLVKELKLKCAYVISNDYKGCVLNWPLVFTKTNCTLSKKEDEKCGKRKRKRKRNK